VALYLEPDVVRSPAVLALSDAAFRWQLIELIGRSSELAAS
jgi:hypothetical protein